LLDYEEKSKIKLIDINRSNKDTFIILHPTWVIFDDREYNYLNPWDEKFRAIDKDIFLKSLMKNKFENDIKINSNTTWSKFSITHTAWYDNIKQHLKEINSDEYLDLLWNRIDIRRLNILKTSPKTVFDLYESKKWFSESDIRTFNIIKVSIDWFASCFLNDLSIKWASFIISKDIYAYEENSSIDVRFDLKIGTNIYKINSSFWITRINEENNHKKISWFFLDSKSENSIFQYINFFELNRKAKKLNI
jgi:hypothetical protein